MSRLAATLLVQREHQVFPKSAWLAELWQYRELLWFLAWRDIKVRYKQTAFGAGWAVLQPLLGASVLTLVFGQLGLTTHIGVPYLLFTYCALVPWMYFSATLTQGGNSLVSHSRLITKVYFPRVLLPASAALSGLVDFLVGTAFLALLMGYFRVRPTWTLLFYPLLTAGLWLFTLGISMFLAALNVRYRDVKHAIPFLVQLGLFATPVIYPTTVLPDRLRQLLVLNPMAGLIEAFRVCLFPQQPIHTEALAASAGIGMAMLLASAVYFRKTERGFADIV